MTVNDLPRAVQLLIREGWFAVVFKGLQVYGIFPQRILADGYIAAVAEREDRGDYKVIGI